MSLTTTILLATFATTTTIQLDSGGRTTLRYNPPPAQGDLVRDGQHPIALLLHQKGGSASDYSDLAARLRRGGLAVVAVNYGKTSAMAMAWNSAQAARRWALKQPGVDATRVYVVGAGLGASVGLDMVRREPKGIQGLVMLSPALETEGLKILPMLSGLDPIPVLMTADHTDRRDLDTLRAVLKLRFPDVRRILRAGLGRGTEQLRPGSSLPDQLVITLRTWAEKNCDRTRPKKVDTLDEGCKR